MEFLREKAELCRTDVELQAVLHKEFSHMTWDYFPIQSTYTQAGLLLVHDIFERDLLEAFAHEESLVPDPSHFQVYQKEAIIAALPYFLHRTASFIVQTIILWPKTWECISILDFPSKPLFVFGTQWSASLLMLHSKLPEELKLRAEQIALEQLNHYNTLDIWVDIFEKWESIPVWAKEICWSHEYTIFWSMVHWAYIEQRFDELLLCRHMSCGALFEQCVRGERIDKGEIEDWLSHSKNKEELSWLCMNVLKRDLHNVCAILSWSPYTLPIHELFSSVGMNDWPDRKAMVELLLQEPERSSVFSDRLLLWESVLGDGTAKSRIVEQLSSRIDPICGCIFWGASTSGTGFDEHFIRELTHFLLCAGNTEQICLHLERGTDDVVQSKSRSIFIDVLGSDVELHIDVPSVHIVHHFLHGLNEPRMSDIDEERLAFLFEGLPKKEWGLQCTSLTSLRCLLQAGKRVCEIPVVLLERVLNDNGTQWVHLLVSYPYREEPLWRIVLTFFQPPATPIVLAERETVMIQRCSDMTKVNLFCAGMIFDSSISSSEKEISRERVLYGLWVSMYAPSSNIQLYLLRCALSFLRKEEYEELKQKYTKTRLWSVFLRWAQSFQSYHPPKLFPSSWTILDFCTAIFERMPQSVCLQVFTSD